MIRPLEVVSDFAISRDLAIFQIESQNFQIKSQIESQCFKSIYSSQIESVNGSNCDLNRDWDLPIADKDAITLISSLSLNQRLYADDIQLFLLSPTQFRLKYYSPTK